MMVMKIIMIIIIIIIIKITPIAIIYTTLFQMISSSQIFQLKLHIHFLGLNCYMSGSSHPSFGYNYNIYKIKVNDMGDNQDTYESNAIPAQAYYRSRGFHVFEAPKF
jgi:hypothetical protein